MPSISHLIQSPQSSEGALRTRSADSLFIVWVGILSGILLFLIVASVLLMACSPIDCWSIRKKIARAGCRIKCGFQKEWHLISVREVLPQFIAHEQQNTPGKEDPIQTKYFHGTNYYGRCPESIEMQEMRMEYTRSDSTESPPPNYEYYRPPEEPLPVYKP
ncbi:uncharacterized protein N7479_009142 [Penicillium vulpinum]|uniref:uncharacterized protein n=1 Tax=Penicillium vulpinum TaxID=29845 RepID=UPI002548E714|nr:uncharacterized protein N7479_009142 [Penicillium vulpinum]KAJ5950729.1 hypothetical protein N7479_009142 [Penicillium vulpinum]